MTYPLDLAFKHSFTTSASKWQSNSDIRREGIERQELINSIVTKEFSWSVSIVTLLEQNNAILSDVLVVLVNGILPSFVGPSLKPNLAFQNLKLSW